MIKGMLFDKDGTLIDFSLWRDASIELIDDIIMQYKLNDEKLYKKLYKSIGLNDNWVEPFGAVASGNLEDIASQLYFVLKKHINTNYENFKIYAKNKIMKEILREDVEYKEKTDLKKLFSTLNKLDIKIGIITSDVEKSVMNFIKKFDLSELIDFIATGDTDLKTKTHNDVFIEFCNKYNFDTDEIAIVGDSYSDMLFAKKLGALSIGVLSGISSKINLKDISDIVIPSIDMLNSEEFIIKLKEEN